MCEKGTKNLVQTLKYKLKLEYTNSYHKCYYLKLYKF